MSLLDDSYLRDAKRLLDIEAWMDDIEHKMPRELQHDYRKIVREINRPRPLMKINIPLPSVSLISQQSQLHQQYINQQQYNNTTTVALPTTSSLAPHVRKVEPKEINNTLQPWTVVRTDYDTSSTLPSSIQEITIDAHSEPSTLQPWSIVRTDYDTSQWNIDMTEIDEKSRLVNIVLKGISENLSKTMQVLQEKVSLQNTKNN